MWDPALDTASLAGGSAATFTASSLAERPLAAREEVLLHFPVCHSVDESIGFLFLDS
jgi:hypothetical protein